MLRFSLALMPSLAIGLLLGRCLPGLPARLAPPLVRWGVPISLVGLLLRSGLHPDLLVSGVMAALASGGGLLLICGLPPLRDRLARASLQLGSVVGNTAYWGLPAALALLPPAALAPVISYDLVGTLVTWSVGPLLLEGRRTSSAAILAALVGSPAGRGLLIALALQQTPWGDAIAALLWWPARAVFLLALSLVGMRLGLMLRAAPGGVEPGERQVGGQGLAFALLAKLVILPAALLAATALLPLPELVGDAVVLQAAAPTAVSVLLIAEAAEARGREGEAGPAAALVAWSTLAALISVPLWWLLLQWLPPG